MDKQRYSYSALQSFKACPLQFFYKYEVGLRLRQEAASQHHLVWGKAMHSALEILYGGSSLWPMYASVHECEWQLQVEAAKCEFINGYPIQLDPADHAKTQDNGVRVLDMYARRWVEEDKRWKVLDVELLDCDLISPDDEEGGYYSRRLDLVVEDLKHGGIYGVDHKTVGGKQKHLRGSYWDSFNPNSQITQYCDWIAQKYGRCDGFYINAIGLNWVDQLDTRGYFNGSSFEPDDPTKPWLEFSHYELQTPKGKKVEKMRAWGLNVQFRREMFNRNEAQIEQERESTKYWIDRIEEARGRCICGHWKEDHRNTANGIFCHAEVVSEELQDVPCPCKAFEQSWGFNTSSCTFCEYKGNAAQPGPCMAGWTWPQDQALIELSYRRECRRVIMLECPECGGDGLDQDWLRNLAESVSALHRAERESYQKDPTLSLHVFECLRCKRTGIVQGPRCVLDLDHEGECSSELPLIPSIDDFVVEVPI